MPEIPEMENYRILLQGRIIDKKILGVEVLREKSINLLTQEFADRLTSNAIVGLKRRAKNLIFELSNGDNLLLHLMLDGWLYWGLNSEDKPERNSQVILHFEDGSSLYFLGLRLGYLHLLTPSQVEEKLKDLGPEPLSESFSCETLETILSKRRGSIKALLLNQKAIAGIGNAYSDEILYEAGILPDRLVKDISNTERLALFRAIKYVLGTATNLGGYMDYPLFEKDEHTGRMNSYFKVYGRPGEECENGRIEIMEIAGRKAHYCPGKQM